MPSQSLENPQALLTAIVESSDDAIVSKDLDGTITSWNMGAERIFGYTAEEAIGRNVRMLIPTDMGSEESRIVEHLRAGERVDHYETKRVRKDGKVIDVSLTVSPVKDARGRVVGASKVARDITDRKFTEASLLDLNARLRELDDMKTQLLNTVSHELRTPLTPLRLQVELLRSRTAGSAENRHSFDIIDRNLQRLTDIVSDMVDVARIEAGKLGGERRATDLRQLVHDAAENYRVAAEHAGVRLAVRGAPAMVMGDPLRLAQVLDNLIANAVKFTPQDGSVAVEVAVHDGTARVCVADSGVGLSREQLDMLFQPFAQVHPGNGTRSGTGLGLFISKGIVEAHGGRIWGESPGPGRGATFAFELPLA
jgi:PAS domain S-box-containing protein